jgi:hypothetical protein
MAGNQPAEIGVPRADQEHTAALVTEKTPGNFRALYNLPAARERIALWHYAGWTSLPLFDRCGSVHAARLKQQGRRLPLFIFEILTSTRRLRVSGLLVAFTQRTHSQRAIGVMSFQRSWIF